MPNLVPFDEVEAIILLSVCKFILDNELTKNSMLVCLSNILRSYAQSKGNHVDNSFRSTSGLSYQTNVMLKYISVGDEFTRVPRIFTTAMEQYQGNALEYERKLWEGLIMSSDNKKQAFLRFLTASRPQSASDIFWALEKAEEYLKSCGVLNGSIYEELSLVTLERLESVISKDNSFVKKHRGMIRFLKLGFSMLKEYVETNITADRKHCEICTDAKENSRSTPQKQTRIISKTASTNNATSFEHKTETLENNHINANSVPVSFAYYNRTVGDLKSWEDLYVKFMKIFWIEKGCQLTLYMGRSFVNEQSIDIGDINTTKRMHKPKRIADNVFVETNFTYREIINRIKAVLDKTSIPTKRFSITYEQPDTGESVAHTPKAAPSLGTTDTNPILKY